MEDAPTLLKIPRSECPNIGIRLPKHKWPRSWSSVESLRSSFGRTMNGEAIRESSIKYTGGKKFRIGNAYLSTDRKGLFLSVYVDDIKLAGEKQNMSPTWKTLMKEVDLGDATSFLHHVYLGGTRRECQIS